MRAALFCAAALSLAPLQPHAQPAAQPTAGQTAQGQSQGDRAKVFASLPNWTGLWMPIGGLIFDTATAEPPGNGAQNPGDRERPPYNAEWEAKYKKALDRTLAGFYTDPITNCVPHGMPRLMGGIPGPLEFVDTPEQTWIIWEWGSQLRRIFTDGRPHLAEDERYPIWNGDSIGHWEGDTLVADTISMRDDTVYDRTGAPHSDQVRMVERIRLLDANTLENDMVITDPVAFTKPWHVVRRYRRTPPGLIIDVICNENQRNPIINGQTQVLLPGDKPGFLMGAQPDKPAKPAAKSPKAKK
jgi:hypothetical protein